MNPLYRHDQGLFHPSPAAAAPGGGDWQHSAAVTGLLAREIQLTPALSPLWLARLTVEAPRAVPMTPVATRRRMLRDGKRLQLVQAELTIDGETCARAIGLRVREGSSPYHAPAPHAFAAPDAAGRSPQSLFSMYGPVRVEIVEPPVSGAPGSFAYWSSCELELVDEERATTVVNAAMACDAAAEISRTVRGETAHPRVDLSLYLARVPNSDWILTENETEYADPSCGLLTSRLSDAGGAFGFAHQTLVYAHAV